MWREGLLVQEETELALLRWSPKQMTLSLLVRREATKTALMRKVIETVHAVILDAGIIEYEFFVIYNDFVFFFFFLTWFLQSRYCGALFSLHD